LIDSISLDELDSPESRVGLPLRSIEGFRIANIFDRRECPIPLGRGPFLNS
jgi:hypothetical protein